MLMIGSLVGKQLAYVPPNSSSRSGWSWWILAYVLLFTIPFLLRWWNRRQADKIVADSPLLLSLYTQGMKLENMSKGTLEGYKYSLMMTEPLQLAVPDGPIEYSGDGRNAVGQAVAMAAVSASSLSNAGKVILTLELPVTSPVHIASLGVADTKTRGIFDKHVASCNLVPASLEGDFPDYFSLFCGTNHQVEVREVLDPTTMAFLVDFCQREDWELFKNILYFASNNLNSSKKVNDSTTMVEDAEDFVKRALPVLQRMDSFAPSNAKP